MKKTFNPTIFIIDSNPVYGKLVMQYLEVADYKEILIFTDVDECLNYLDLHPDIIISEFYHANPIVSGLNFLETIHRRSPGTDVIFFTSQTDVELAVKAIRLGAAEFIVKSKYAPDTLLRKVNKLVNFRYDMYRNSRVRKKLAATVGVLLILTILLVYIYIH